MVAVQGGSGGKINILGRDITGHFEKKILCLILNDYRDKAL
jgi:hypothetical protein